MGTAAGRRPGALPPRPNLVGVSRPRPQSDEVELFLLPIYHDHGPVGAVLAERGIHLEPVGELDKELYVLALVQGLCEATLNIRLVDQPVVDGALDIYDLVEVADEFLALEEHHVIGLSLEPLVLDALHHQLMEGVPDGSQGQVDELLGVHLGICQPPRLLEYAGRGASGAFSEKKWIRSIYPLNAALHSDFFYRVLHLPFFPR